MDYSTNIRDSNGNTILHGMFLMDIHCQYLTYQVRLRNNNFVIHTGSSYSLLTPNRAKSLVILGNMDDDILGYGHHLFESAL